MRTTVLLLLMSGSLFLGCSSSKSTLTASSKVSGQEPETYSKLAVLALAHKTSARANVEEAIATEFRTKGVKAVSTFTMFPLANHMEEVKKNMDATDEQIRERVREKIDLRQIDGVLVLALLNTKEEERYVQKGMSLSVAGPAVSYADPVYNYEFTDYYTYSYATIYNPGYYETSKTFFVEANFYDMPGGQLVYTAQFDIKDPDKLGADSEELAMILVEDMLRKKAVKK